LPSFPKYAEATNAVVKGKSKAVYIFALVSKDTLPGENRIPREKAPRMLEMVEPTTLPKASRDRCWRVAATTTANWL
jgi:hypothetical protein